ncbi:MAG TPA: hypothetical protein VN915_14850 [Elusimicrobiota bacterium]|nr:hypothetical protein [Elusimicrobiota bacterium]
MERANRVTVFEAVNRTRRQVFIGATTQPMHALIAGFRASPPAGTADWRPDEVEFRSMAFDVDAREAADSIRRYAQAHEGWMVLTDPAGISR